MRGGRDFLAKIGTLGEELNHGRFAGRHGGGWRVEQRGRPGHVVGHSARISWAKLDRESALAKRPKL